METKQAKRKTDRMLHRSYLDDIHEVSYEVLKARRDETLAVEREISYGRRLLQGKLDILKHALEAGEKGEDRSLKGAIDQLPAILADSMSGSPQERHTPIAPPSEKSAGRREPERLAGEVADIEKMSPDELLRTVQRLTEAEKKASIDRKRVQRVIDMLNDELVRRLQKQHRESSG